MRDHPLGEEAGNARSAKSISPIARARGSRTGVEQVEVACSIPPMYCSPGAPASAARRTAGQRSGWRSAGSTTMIAKCRAYRFPRRRRPHLGQGTCFRSVPSSGCARGLEIDVLGSTTGSSLLGTEPRRSQHQGWNGDRCPPIALTADAPFAQTILSFTDAPPSCCARAITAAMAAPRSSRRATASSRSGPGRCRHLPGKTGSISSPSATTRITGSAYLRASRGRAGRAGHRTPRRCRSP